MTHNEVLNLVVTAYLILVFALAIAGYVKLIDNTHKGRDKWSDNKLLGCSLLILCVNHWTLSFWELRWIIRQIEAYLNTK